MKIVQTFWSGGSSPTIKPYGWPTAEFNMMSWALSCCSLREHYDSVELYTDQRGYEILIKDLCLPYTQVHVIYDDNLCLPVHWAYAKIKTYSLQDEPFLHIDGDMYFPQPISEDILAAPLITQNREIGTGFYRSMMARVLRHPEIHLPHCIQDSLRCRNIASYNMGIFGGHDLTFIKAYCKQAFDFLNENKMNDASNTYAWEECNILFEQVLFAVQAELYNKEVATIGRPMRDEGYMSHEFCNLTDYDNKKFFHILGGHKGSQAVCYALERVLLTHYPEYFERIVRLFPLNHPRLTSPKEDTSKNISQNKKDGFEWFLREKRHFLNRITREKVLEQEKFNSLFFAFANKDKMQQKDYIVRRNPYIFIYDFNTEEKKLGPSHVAQHFTRKTSQEKLCSAIILPGIDKHRNKIIPVNELGKNVIAILRNTECTYGELRYQLWQCFPKKLQKQPKTLAKYILKEITYLAYNGIIYITQSNYKHTKEEL